MSLPAGLLALALLLGGCSYGPVVDRSGFESAVLTPDQRTVVLVYRVLRYRPAEGLAAFPDGGIPRYLDDRLVIAAVPVAGGAPRVLQRLEARGAQGSGGAGLRVAVPDPDHVLVLYSAPNAQPSGRWWRLGVRDGQALPYPDLAADLKRQGRTLGSPEFGDIRVIAPDGTLLIGARGPAGDELWLRRPDGVYVRLDSLTHFYGVEGDELYYWAANEARVRSWRSMAVRVIARYDPDRRQTSTLIRNDPTVAAIDAHRDAPSEGVSISSDRATISLGRRGADGAWTYRPLAVDPTALQR